MVKQGDINHFENQLPHKVQKAAAPHTALHLPQAVSVLVITACAMRLMELKVELSGNAWMKSLPSSMLAVSWGSRGTQPARGSTSFSTVHKLRKNNVN